MQRLKVRSTVHHPMDAKGRSVGPGDVLFVDADDPYVETQLAVGHFVPVGKIPRLEPSSGDDAGS